MDTSPPTAPRAPLGLPSLRDVDRASRIGVLRAVAMVTLALAAALVPLASLLGGMTDGVARRLDIAGAGFVQVPTFPEKSTLYARDGSVIASLFLDENRDVARLEDIAEVAQLAVLAIEDDEFYAHGALDVPALVRALVANVAAGEITQGGSTITQQLVKLAVIGDDTQSFARKFQEAALAFRLEERYTKDEILELYMNEVYLGNGVYGFGTASNYYFGVPPSDLTLEQAALLAGMIQRPATYDPVLQPDAARDRRNLVLERLRVLGWVDEDTIERAKAAPITVVEEVGEEPQLVQPFFVYFITRSILDMENREFDVFGTTTEQRIRTLYQGGLEIHTTLDADWQRYAQQAVNQNPDIDPREGPDVSLATVDTRTGAIRALLSGKNYLRDQLDLAWLGRRQVGSSFKAITLAAAFEAGIPPGKVYDKKSPWCDERWISETGCVSNAEGGNKGGFIDLRSATTGSVNVVFAQLALDIGPERIVDVAHRLGISAPLDPVPSITLGVEEVSTLEMAAAYASLANDGSHCETYAIDRVLLPDGQPLYEHEVVCEQAIAPEVAHQVTSFLQGAVEYGTGTAARIPGRPVAGKTGTGQDYTNVYFAGYTRQLATAVWVGYPAGNIPMNSYYGRSVFGGTLAAPIWGAYMTRVVRGMPVESFPSAPGGGSGTVPDVVGMTREQAEVVLLAANFTPVIEKVPSIGPAGIVLAQSPAPGSTLTLGGPVTIQIPGKGGVIEGVPDLIGMTQSEAEMLLGIVGLTAQVGTTQVSDPGLDGVVVQQAPAPGAPLPADGIVTILIGVWDGSQPPPSPVDPPSPVPSPNGRDPVPALSPPASRGPSPGRRCRPRGPSRRP